MISEKHAQVITHAIGTLPRSLEPDVLAAAERTLAGHAQGLCPSELGRAAEHFAAHLDPDGALTSDLDRARRRHLTIGPQDPDGMSAVRGLLTPQCRALLDAAIAALARPTPDGQTRDPRNAGQRNHDALAALCSQLLADGTLPSNRGLPATVVITMTVDQLETALAESATEDAPRPPRARDSRCRPNPDGATARTATSINLPLPDAVRMAARAHPVLAVFDHGGQALFLGHGTRLSTPAQRLALTARDRGCTRPGCSAPPAWCEVHHLTEWQHDGGTDITNLALVCPYDHHLITTTGYTVQLGTDGAVEWTAPAHLDPTRTPRANPLHHPPDLTDHDPPDTSGDRPLPRWEAIAS